MESRDHFGTSLICDVLEAYRRDLARTPDVVHFGPADAAWLRAALRIESLTAGARLTRPRARQLAARPALAADRLLRLTERMESAGALTLAFATLAAVRRVWDLADPASAGTAIFRQARICRTMGETTAAENYYTYLFTHATRHRLPELRGRALIGRGIMRTVGGDPRAGIRWYAKARSVAPQNAIVQGISWHAEMGAALSLPDRDRALLAGQRALATQALAGHDEAGVLINMAEIAVEADHHREALTLVRRAIKCSGQPRLRLHAYGKAAKAAALLGRRRLLEQLAAGILRLSARVTTTLDVLEARSELAEAIAFAGDMPRAVRLAKAVHREAEPLGFRIIVARCERIIAGSTRRTTAKLSAPARRALTAAEHH